MKKTKEELPFDPMIPTREEALAAILAMSEHEGARDIGFDGTLKRLMEAKDARHADRIPDEENTVMIAGKCGRCVYDQYTKQAKAMMPDMWRLTRQ